MTPCHGVVPVRFGYCRSLQGGSSRGLLDASILNRLDRPGSVGSGVSGGPVDPLVGPFA